MPGEGKRRLDGLAAEEIAVPAKKGKSARRSLISSFQGDIVLGEPQLDASSTKYLPFLHGTTSKIFALLHRTDMALWPLSDLLEKFHLAPLTGELNAKGGAVGPLGRGGISFGRFDLKSYSLKDIIAHYATTVDAYAQDGDEVEANLSSIEKLKKWLSEGRETAFLKIKFMMVYLVRAKYESADLAKEIDEALFTKTFDEMQSVISYLYFLLLIGKYIHPAAHSISKLSLDDLKNLRIVIEECLSFEHIVDKIQRNKLDFKAIYNKAAPSKEDLELIDSLLRLPPMFNLPIYSSESKELELIYVPTPTPITNPFRICKVEDAEQLENVKKYHYDSRYAVGQILTNGSGRKLGYILKDYASPLKGESMFPFHEMHPSILEYLPALERCMDFFKQLVMKPQAQFKLTEEEAHYLEKPFPIILLCENRGKMKESYSDQGNLEFSSKEPIYFGKDVTKIAVETNEQAQVVMQYLEKHHVKQIDVISFADLKRSEKTGLAPSVARAPLVWSMSSSSSSSSQGLNPSAALSAPTRPK